MENICTIHSSAQQWSSTFLKTHRSIISTKARIIKRLHVPEMESVSDFLSRPKTDLI